MSCGTKITPRFDTYSERMDMAERLEDEIGYSTARKLRYGECLDFREVQDVERALERQGKMKHYDYREELCVCRDGEEDW